MKMTDQALKNKKVTLICTMEMFKRVTEFAHSATMDRIESSSLLVSPTTICRACIEFTLRHLHANKREIDGIIDGLLLSISDSKKSNAKVKEKVGISKGKKLTLPISTEDAIRVHDLIYVANRERIESFSVRVNRSIIYRAYIEYAFRHGRINKKEVDGIIDELLHSISESKRGK